MTPERTIELALDNGFKLKVQPDGSLALNPYVFDFVKAVIEDPSDSHVRVDREALRQVLNALNGAPYEIRELQVTRSLPIGPKNAINILIEDYNRGIT